MQKSHLRFFPLFAFGAILSASALTAPNADASEENSSTSATTRTYTITANNRDAMSVLSDVRISGFNAQTEPYDFVGADGDQETSAVEFTVDVPIGASIEDARLIIHAGPFQNESPSGALTIHLYDVVDALPFSDSQTGDLVGHHPTYATTVPWPAPANWVEGQDYESPNLANLVQHWVSKPGYVPGMHIGFAVTNGTIQPSRYYGWADYAANETHARLSVRYSSSSTAVPSGTSASAHGLQLFEPNPNPFRQETTFAFATSGNAPIRLSIYEASGRLLETLADGVVTAGTHRIEWNGRGPGGSAAPGVYFVRLESAGESATRRVVKVR